MSLVFYGYGLSPGGGAGGTFVAIGDVTLDETVIDVAVDPEDIVVTLDETTIDVEVTESG